MIRNVLVPMFLAAALFALPGSSATVEASTPSEVPKAEMFESRASYRQHIRGTPLMRRPNRPGHFIGNTLRRRGR